MLAAVVLVVAVATTLVGVCSLLLSQTGPRAFSEEIRRSQAQEVDVTAYVVGLKAADLPAVREQARGAVERVLAPMHPSVFSLASSRMRRLGDGSQLGYLATSDDPPRQARLTAGRWPVDGGQGVLEAVAPEAALHALHLRLGDRVDLGSETGLDAVDRPTTVVVVGTFQPVSRAAWASDALSGAGVDRAYSDGSVTAPAFGPFIVGPTAFLGTGANVAGLRVDAHPSLVTADESSLRAAATSLDSASSLLSAGVGSSARITRVASELPETLDRIDGQQSATRSAVLVVLLLTVVLAIAALVLAGRIVADSRAEERELLSTLGLGPRQQATGALLEAGLLAVAAAVLAVPAAAAAHSLVTHLPDLRTAGLTQDPHVTSGLVVTVLGVALLMTLVLVVAPLLTWETGRLPARRRALARSSVDVLLAVMVVGSWWQLFNRPATNSGSDVTLTLAPAVCLTAATILAVRRLPSLLAMGAAAASRSRALLPLALHPAALRLSAGTPLVLLSTASAAAVFGVALHATWLHSQTDQADLRAGTNLSLTFFSPPTAGEAAAVDAAASGTATALGVPRASPVTRRPVALGRYVGDVGDEPELVAIDARHAGSLLRGRLDGGRTWTGIGRQLVSGGPLRGPPMPTNTGGVHLTGTTSTGAMTVAPSVIVQDGAGFRSVLDAAPVRLDGADHPLRWSTPPAAGQRIVAVRLSIIGDGSQPEGGTTAARAWVRMRITGSGTGDDSHWRVRPLGRDSPVRGTSISVDRAAGATVLTATAGLDLSYLAYADGDLLATAFEPPLNVPIAVSRRLLDAIGTKIGGELTATIDDTALPVRVAAVVPTVPSEPGRIAVLADVDTLSRALIAAGRLDPAVDAAWVSGPSSGTADAVAALRLGEVTNRATVAADLTRGPMQVTVPLAYLMLVVACTLLLLVGAVLVVSADRRRRVAEVARLRALGLTRPGARRLLFVEHSSLLVPLVLIGILVGGLGAVALEESLIRSDRGTSPVPQAVLTWPWATEAVLVLGLVVGCLVVAALSAAWQVRRSDTTERRTGRWT